MLSRAQRASPQRSHPLLNRTSTSTDALRRGRFRIALRNEPRSLSRLVESSMLVEQRHSSHAMEEDPMSVPRVLGSGRRRAPAALLCLHTDESDMQNRAQASQATCRLERRV